MLKNSNFRRNIPIVKVNLDDYDLCSLFPRNARRQTMIVNEKVAANVSAFCQYDPIPLGSSYATIPVTINTFANHFMFHIIDEVVTQIIPFGIPLHWLHFHTWNRCTSKTNARPLRI
jgi:hypothetical protein